MVSKSKTTTEPLLTSTRLSCRHRADSKSCYRRFTFFEPSWIHSVESNQSYLQSILTNTELLAPDLYAMTLPLAGTATNIWLNYEYVKMFHGVESLDFKEKYAKKIGAWENKLRVRHLRFLSPLLGLRYLV